MAFRSAEVREYPARDLFRRDLALADVGMEAVVHVMADGGI